MAFVRVLLVVGGIEIIGTGGGVCPTCSTSFLKNFMNRKQTDKQPNKNKQTNRSSLSMTIIASCFDMKIYTPNRRFCI